MESLISVVVPIYNVEKYLEQCVESLITQTYTNMEIILVNDGSTDGSGDICEEYRLKDDRIKIIHKANGGLSDARNVGLEYANGEFIAFIDSDDYVDKNMIKSLYDACIECKAEIAACYYKKVTDREVPRENKDISKEYKIYSGEEIIKKIYVGECGQVSFTAWNKLYKKELLTKNNISYPIGRLHEDTFVTFKMFYYASKVAIVEKELYYYRVREQSIMTTNMTLKRCMDGIDSDMESVIFYNNYKEYILLSFSLDYFFKTSMLTYLKSLKGMDKLEQLECKKYIKDRYVQVWEQYGKYGKCDMRKKIAYAVFYLFLKLNINV